jgi:hypothetical protein
MALSPDAYRRSAAIRSVLKPMRGEAAVDRDAVFISLHRMQ